MARKKNGTGNAVAEPKWAATKALKAAKDKRIPPPSRGDQLARSLSIIAYHLRTVALRERRSNSGYTLMLTGPTYGNQAQYMNMIARQISVLMSQNPSTNPAMTAKSWFVNFGGDQPAEVNAWMESKLDSTDDSGTYTLANNADLYYEAILQNITEFSMGLQPDDTSEVEAWNWFRGPVGYSNQTINPPPSVVNFMKSRLPTL